MSPHHGFRLTILCLLMTAFAGCTASRLPVYMNSHLGQLHLRTIAVLPVVDKRADRSKQLDLDTALRKPAEEILKRKNYQVVATDFAKDGSIDATAVAEMSDAALSALVPEGADAAALIYLEDLRDEYGFKIIWVTYEFELVTSTRIVSKDHGMLFQDRAVTTRRA